ncbi:MAG TPA: hypothetical protein VJ602_03460, partial [Paludibacter sp.]|nr:hypothetical protein [Paludibacter sp.]
KHGHLILDYPVNKRERNVRVIILVDDQNDEDEEQIWLKGISSNPAFDFLNEPSENIYSLTDGEPFNDKE